MFPSFSPRTVVAALLALLLAGAAAAPPARAQVYETRESSANPMVEVFKSTIYGGLAGLLLGSALALALNDDNNEDTVKWAFVGGTFFGFGYGVYHVTTRPQPHALLEGTHDGWAFARPDVTLEMATARPGVATALRAERATGITAHATLASLAF